MRENFKAIGLCIAILFSFHPVFCQINKDSTLIANSEKLSVKLNKGLFGLSKPAFGTIQHLLFLKSIQQ